MANLIPMRHILSRSITTTPSRLWAAAAAVAPAPVSSSASPTKPTRTYVRKTVPIKSTSAAKPISKPTSRAAVTAASPITEFEDFEYDDYPTPISDIEDYAHLAPPSVRSDPIVASPPLTSMPDSNYRPLPSAPSAPQHILGEVPAPPSSDWSTSFSGLSERPFDKEIADILLRPLSVADIEMKPDGLIYLPEIKYRKTLNQAFGPGGWGLAPRGETNVGPKIVSREWGLVCLGRLVSIARGEQEYFDPSGVATATEACKSNALMRCCKDLGIASELWDPVFIREFKRKHCVEVFAEHALTKKKKKLWRKKDAPKFDYPYKE